LPDWLRDLVARLDVLRPLLVRLTGLAGVEVTQGIQHYRADQHLTDPADRGADNSLRLVAGKPAWIRVYLRAGVIPSPGWTGRVIVRRRTHRLLWLPVATLAPQPPGTVTAEVNPVYADERGDIARTLNFVVPADVMCGRLRFEIEVWRDANRRQRKTVSVDALLDQTLGMRIVPVAYDGPDASGTANITIAAPTLADAQATAAWSLLVYPVRSVPDIQLCASVQLTFGLTGNPANPGGCAQSWIDLNVLVAAAKTACGNTPSTFYYGLVPQGVPIGFNSGCASSGVTSGFDGGQITMAHEFGHALGFGHTPCGLPPAATDPNYPAYEPYDAVGAQVASIGEFGLDVNTGNVMSPAQFRDFMSYCGPSWISIYTHRRSLEHPMLSPTTCGDDQRWRWDHEVVEKWRRPWRPPDPDPPPWFDEVVVKPETTGTPLISLVGVRHATGELEVRSLARVVASADVPGARGTDLAAQLVGEDGEALAAAPVLRLVSHGHGGCCGGSGDDEPGPADAWAFQAFVPDAGRGTALRIVDAAGRAVWRRDAPDRPPSPPRLRADPSARELRLEWELEKGDAEPAEVWIRWRAGDEEEASVLHVAHAAGSIALPPGRLPPGRVRLDALVHDGFDVVVGEEVEVEIEDPGPAVAILHPSDGATVEAGRALRLLCVVTPPDAAGRVSWFFDGKPAGEGLDVFVAAPPAGEHDVMVAVEGERGRADRTVRLRTIDPAREERSAAP
jgi:hypothetical protein